MSYSYRYSYNPFAVRRLRHFLRKNWIALSILFIVFASSIALLDRLLPPLPPEVFVGEPSLDNPGPIDLEKGLAPGPGNSQLALGEFLPAIDPEDVLCPISFYDSNTAEHRYDIVNLASQETIFLAAFTQGIFWNTPLYRPEYNEILIAKSGLRDSFWEQLLLKVQLYLPEITIIAMPEMKMSVHRFDAATGAYRDRLDFPLSIKPIDVSPDGSRLLALRGAELSLMGMGQPMVIDLASGQSVELPLFTRHCFFESDEILIVVLESTFFRYFLKEHHFEKVFTPPEDFGIHEILNDFNYARQSGKIYFSNIRGGRRLGCISLDGQAPFEYWDYYGGSYIQASFQPERELQLQSLPSGAWGIAELKSGQIIKTFPRGFYWRCLSRDFLSLRSSGKFRIVRIDDVLDESFEFEVNEEDK